MDAEIKRKWIKALRSGKYKQGRFKLARLDKDSDIQFFCCIGVGFCVSSSNANVFGIITCTASLALGLDAEQQDILVQMNDVAENNFAEIADYIEQNL